MTTGQAVTALITANAIGGLIGVCGWRLGLPDYVLFAAIAACFAGYFTLSTLAWQRVEATDTGVYIVTGAKWSSAMSAEHFTVVPLWLLRHARPPARGDL